MQFPSRKIFVHQKIDKGPTSLDTQARWATGNNTKWQRENSRRTSDKSVQTGNNTEIIHENWERTGGKIGTNQQ
jgi:hypothetical protein